MLTKPTEAIVLLYPPKNQTMKDLRGSLGRFCARCSLVITEIITLEDEYDQKSMKRFEETISYYTGPIALVANRSMFDSLLPLTLWSMLGLLNSNKITQSTRHFLNKIKDSAGKLHKNSFSDFYLLNSKEVGYLADWITEVRYFMEQSSKEPRS